MNRVLRYLTIAAFALLHVLSTACRSSEDGKPKPLEPASPVVADRLRLLVGHPAPGQARPALSVSPRAARPGDTPASTWVADVGDRFAYRYLRVDEPTESQVHGATVRGPLKVSVASHVLVQFRHGVVEHEVQDFARHQGLKPEPVPFSPNLYRMQIDVEAQRRQGLATADLTDVDTVPRVLSRCQSEATLVAFAEPDHVLFISDVPEDQPDARVPANMWALHNYAQPVKGRQGAVDADIDAPQAWDVVYGTDSAPAEVTVAVIDTGIDYTHPEFRRADGTSIIDTEHDYDFSNNDDDAMDDEGHGTHVAGTIAASMDSAGAVGVARNVRIIPIKFFDAHGYGTTSAAVSSINYASDLHANRGVRILATSNSWGGGSPDQSLYQAINCAGNPAATCPARNPSAEPMLFIAAAGNDGRNTDSEPDYPSSYIPAPFDNILSVGASDASDQRAAFSNYGSTTVDLFAPGVGIYSALPGGAYEYYNGTSMATPHVTAVAALVRQLNPAMSVSAIRQAILDGVERKPGLVNCVTQGRLNAIGAIWQDARFAVEQTDIDDAPIPGYPNNGDGRLGVSERVGLTFRVVNTGGVAAREVRGRLRSLDTSVVRVLDEGYVGFSDGQPIDARGGTATTNTPIQVEVQPFEGVKTARFALDILWEGLSSPQTVTVTLVAGPTILVSGRLALDGQPVSGAAVQLRTAGAEVVDSVTSNAAGEYKFAVFLGADTLPGAYTVHVPGSPNRAVAWKTVLLADGDVTADFDYVTSTIDVRVSARETGLAISQAVVTYDVPGIGTWQGPTSVAGLSRLQHAFEGDSARLMRIAASGVALGFGSETQEVALPANTTVSFSLGRAPYRTTVIDGAAEYPGAAWTHVVHMNARGQIIGDIETLGSGTRSFVFEDANGNGLQDPGEFRLLDEGIEASRINQEGWVLAREQGAGLLMHVDAPDRRVALGQVALTASTSSTAPTSSAGGIVVPQAMNELGAILGGMVYSPIATTTPWTDYVLYPTGVGAQRVWYSPGGAPLVNSLLVPLTNLDATHLNNHGHVVGRIEETPSVVLYHRGRQHVLQLGRTFANPRANDRGHVLFDKIESADQRIAQLWAPTSTDSPFEGVVHTIDGMLYTYEKGLHLAGVNDLDEAVGAFEALYVRRHAIWSIQEQQGRWLATHRHDISEYMPSTVTVSSGGLQSINDCGQVAGGAFDYLRERTVVYMLTPTENRGFVRVFAGGDVQTPSADTGLQGFYVDCQKGRQPTLVQWTQVSGPAAATLASPNSVATNLTLPSAGQYTFKLAVVIDGVTKEDTVVVQYQPVETAVPLVGTMLQASTLSVSSGLAVGQTFVPTRATPLRAVDVCRPSQESSTIPLDVRVSAGDSLSASTYLLHADPQQAQWTGEACGVAGSGMAWRRYHFGSPVALASSLHTVHLVPSTIMSFVVDISNPYPQGRMLHSIEPARYAQADLALRLVY